MLVSARLAMRGSDALIEYPHRMPPRPRVLVGVGLGLLALVCWTGHVTSLTYAVSACLAALAATLIRSGLPRRDSIRIDPSRGVLETRTISLSLADVSRVDLRAAAGDALGRARTSYSAIAVKHDGRKVELLESGDPTELIRFARAIQGALEVRVTWDFEQPTLANWLASGPITPTERHIRGRAYARQRKASLMTWVVAIGLGITWAVFILRAERPPSLFSLSLATGSLLFAFLTAAVVTFNVTLVSLGQTIRFERRVLGFRIFDLKVQASDVLRVSSLAPNGEAGHLLLVTRDAAYAVPLAEPANHRAMQLLTGAA